MSVIFKSAPVQQYFEEKKFVVLKSFLPQELSALVYRYALKKSWSGQMSIEHEQVPNTPSSYGDMLMETLMELTCPAVELAIGRKLFPTYSYFRVYKRGDVLKRHVDRPACEFTMTLMIGYQAPASWPIHFQSDGEVVSLDLQPGDAAVFRGMELEHWREEFDGEHYAQVFLHYVDQNGPHAEWKYDKRENFVSVAAVG